MADTVLKPFQIRNLHVYPAEENLYDSSTESVISSSPTDESQIRPSCLIQLSAGEYDKIISDHPNGTLTYIDDDDGDLITVGSSFELEQRLDESSQYKTMISRDQPEPSPIHLFDIRRRRSIIKLWKDIEKNSKIRWARLEDEFLEEPKSSEAGTSFEPRGLDVNESTDSRQRWLDACRPPRLQSQQTLEKESPYPTLKDIDSSSPTIMSLSAITDEGRRQAEEAGSRIRSMWNAPASVSHAAPDFIRNQENPWAASVEPVTDDNDSNHSSEAQLSNIEVESQPLLSAFEAEMAKILENSQKPVNDANSPNPPPEPQNQRPEPIEQIWPVNLVTGVLQAVVDGIENMGSELKTRIPEMERHLANAQRTIPDDIGTKMQTALSAFESQVQNLAQIVQQASDASGEAAERVRQADLRSTEQMLNGLGDIAHEFEDFGKTLFAAFEAEFGQRKNGNEADVTDSMNASQDANPAQSQAQAQEDVLSSTKVDLPQESLDKASEAAAPAAYQSPVPPAPLSPDLREQLPPHLRESLLSELKTATSQVLLSDAKDRSVQQHQPKPQLSTSTPRESILSEIRSRATSETSLLPEIISRATQQDSQHPEIKSRVTQQESLSSEIRSRAMQNNQPQSQQQETEKPLFSSWPNRPAFVPPPFIPTTTRPPVPPKAVNDKPTPHMDARPAGPFDTRDERSEDMTRSLFMGNIGFEVTERVIEEVFASHLFSAKVHLPIDSSTGKHAGFGYARFPSVSSAKAALARLQGVVIDGHSLNLEHCDNSPIDDLQTQIRPNDSLPSVFSGNARSTNSRISRPTFAQSSSLNPFDHPEETPEFAARYPSLLPTYKPKNDSLAIPPRSMTLSPNSEMARFPPVSQIDAHLLANNQRRDLTETSQDRPRPHSVTGPQQQETRRVGEEIRLRKPRRVASTIHRGSTSQLDAQTSNAHTLRRRATEANTLRRRAHENPFRDPRPVSLYDRPAGSIPGSFPVDDTPAPVTTNEESNSDGEFRYAMRQSLIDQCVDHLLKLGYGTYIDGGRDRLRIIAEAANLQVSDAIDMIEEERMAYERYTPNA
ncbi:uncharacterized protein BHQ10_001321 [Talaromyces amestolkiae]|uniref:RRM domain-containing protein n=1 Tax=Talaromyces amestolkiae TaxID=1196081 RepID=A0A364KP46_TALAM|nr:uncharacterized protein BHQ10_001321 [Talaromyces amestolkiae]RAO65309.1 hypothetical protein BHQ10_001321 [Talaromyces amestolkiae]